MALKGECVRALDGRYTQRIILGERSYFIKQHFGIGWKEVFKNLSQLRLPIFGAQNEWQAIARLNKQNLRTPKIVAYGSQGHNPARRKSFVLMEEIKDVIQLDHHCAQWSLNPPTFAHKQQLIKELARIVRIMHRSGVNHRDCYLCHFLLGKNGEITLIDFHRAQIRNIIPSRWVIKDLAGLYFSSKDFGLTARDRLRFIKAYTEQPLRDVLHKEKHFWDKVIIRGEKLYRQHT